MRYRMPLSALVTTSVAGNSCADLAGIASAGAVRVVAAERGGSERIWNASRSIRRIEEKAKVPPAFPEGRQVECARGHLG